MRHSDRAVQLPRSASGNRLCRHQAPGSCTHWCSYKLFTKTIATTLAVLAAICSAVYLTGQDGETRAEHVLFGVGFFLAVVIPGITLVNGRERD